MMETNIYKENPIRFAIYLPLDVDLNGGVDWFDRHGQAVGDTRCCAEDPARAVLVSVEAGNHHPELEEQ